MLLSTREKEMIALLIKYHGQYITIHDIAQQLAVSSRTIHRELKGVEAYLTSFSLTLERANKKGLRIAGTDEAKTNVIHSGLTLLQIPEGVDWDGEVVKVVVGIAGKDGEHLDLLSKIAITFSEEENVDRIVQAKSAEEIKQVFEEADA